MIHKIICKLVLYVYSYSLFAVAITSHTSYMCLGFELYRFLKVYGKLLTVNCAYKISVIALAGDRCHLQIHAIMHHSLHNARCTWSIISQDTETWRSYSVEPSVEPGTVASLVVSRCETTSPGKPG